MLLFAQPQMQCSLQLHALLDRQDELAVPQCSDLFGSRGPTGTTPFQLAHSRFSASVR
jgi:hypothetical protein